MRVALVGDWPLVRSGFRQVLQSAGIGVIASVADAADASTVLRRVGADAVVVSALTCEGGVIDTRTIVAIDSRLPVLVLGRCADPDSVQRVVDAGARGYLVLEQVIDADLIHAVRRVAAGELCLSPGLCVPQQPALPSSVDSAYARLTRRERQVLTLLAGGRSNREIAAALRLSVNTVATHRASLKRTLAIRQVAALVRVAVRHGLVPAE
ncbi:MAG TPA: response regulator transcription factor [Vicinamibacterales bacterium]|nr:response regulator transcription factor [Vicinamibacterales bacterium]